MMPRSNGQKRILSHPVTSNRLTKKTRRSSCNASSSRGGKRGKRDCEINWEKTVAGIPIKTSDQFVNFIHETMKLELSQSFFEQLQLHNVRKYMMEELNIEVKSLKDGLKQIRDVDIKTEMENKICRGHVFLHLYGQDGKLAQKPFGEIPLSLDSGSALDSRSFTVSFSKSGLWAFFMTFLNKKFSAIGGVPIQLDGCLRFGCSESNFPFKICVRRPPSMENNSSVHLKERGIEHRFGHVGVKFEISKAEDLLSLHSFLERSKWLPEGIWRACCLLLMDWRKQVDPPLTAIVPASSTTPIKETSRVILQAVRDRLKLVDFREKYFDGARKKEFLKLFEEEDGGDERTKSDIKAYCRFYVKTMKLHPKIDYDVEGCFNEGQREEEGEEEKEEEVKTQLKPPTALKHMSSALCGNENDAEGGCEDEDEKKGGGEKELPSSSSSSSSSSKRTHRPQSSPPQQQQRDQKRERQRRRSTRQSSGSSKMIKCKNMKFEDEGKKLVVSGFPLSAWELKHPSLGKVQHIKIEADLSGEEEFGCMETLLSKFYTVNSRNLKVLDLSSTKLSKMPPLIRCGKLEDLNLSFNNLTIINKERLPRSIVSLDVSENRLKSSKGLRINSKIKIRFFRNQQPASIEIKPSPLHGLGAFTTVDLPADTDLGVIKGDYTFPHLSGADSLHSFYVLRKKWARVEGQSPMLKVECGNLQDASWHRFINGCRKKKEKPLVNVRARLYKSKNRGRKEIHVFTTREIEAGTELVMEYVKDYWKQTKEDALGDVWEEMDFPETVNMDLFKKKKGESSQHILYDMDDNEPYGWRIFDLYQPSKRKNKENCWEGKLKQRNTGKPSSNGGYKVERFFKVGEDLCKETYFDNWILIKEKEGNKRQQQRNQGPGSSAIPNATSNLRDSPAERKPAE